MLEKLSGAGAMVGCLAALMGIRMLDLPLFITAILVLICVAVYLIGLIFLFNEGSMIKSFRQK